jgi:aspartate-semialdehyde dehydrogenase
MKKLNLALIGASGAVGRTFLQVLEQRGFMQKYNVGNFYPFASSRSAGKKIIFNETEYTIEELTETSFDRGIDIVLSSAGGAISEKFLPIAVSKGCVAIDNTSFYRMKDDVPLVVPEVNPEDIRGHNGIIANPNCSVIPVMVALKPLYDKYGIKRIVFSTYQAVSGAGQSGIEDLENGLNGLPPKKFPHPIAKNCIPQIDSFLENGYTKEEMKMENETRKILHAPEIKVTATTVRVPVVDGHCIAANVEFNKPFDLDDIIETLRKTNGVTVQNGCAKGEYPMPLYAAGKDDVFVGRIRRDFSVDNGINIWVVSDNTRKGAATNAIQIAEWFIENM